MKPILSLMIASTLVLGSCSKAVPQFSTFSDHYLSVMQQQGSTLLEAAQWIKSIGIDGVDAKTTLSPEQMAQLQEAGIKPACAILDLSYSRQSPEEMLQMEDKAIDFCKEYGFDKLMYCPVLLPPTATEFEKDSLRRSVQRFSEKVIAEGLDLIFEDYDNERSITYNMEALDKIFDLVPSANHAYDSGNFIYAGDDPMVAFKRV